MTQELRVMGLEPKQHDCTEAGGQNEMPQEKVEWDLREQEQK